MIQKADFSRDMLNKLVGTSLPCMGNDTSLAVALLGAVCVYCYMQEPVTDDTILKQYTLYVPLLAMGVLFISFKSYPYWYVHLAPYLAIMLVYNRKYRDKLFVFETFGMGSLALGQYIQYYWCFDVTNGRHMLLEKLFGNIGEAAQPVSLISFIEQHNLTDFVSILYSVYLVLLIAFVWYSRPGDAECVSGAKPIRPLAMGRLMGNALIAYIPLMFYISNFL